MTKHEPHEQLLAQLNDTVADAVAFFNAADEDLFDGYQTAREVLSHFVFWHSEYVGIVWALVTGRQPSLLYGTFAELNARATQQYNDESLPVLAERLAHRQGQLAKALRRLPDWGIDFPIKQIGRDENVASRVVSIESHIRNHVARLRHAAHLKEAQREYKVAA